MASVLKTAVVATTRVIGDQAGANQNIGLAGFNLNDLAEEGRKQLASCQVTAQQLVEDAKQQAERIRKQAFDSGYAEGTQKAIQDNDKKIKAAAEARAQEQLATLTAAVQELYRGHERWMQEYAESLFTLALEASERIVRHRLDNEREIVIRWVADAIQTTRAATKLTVAIHPDMLAELGQSLDELLASPEFPTDTYVVPDEHLRLTDVVIRQEGGEIHAGLTAQLERLSEMLK